MPLRFIRALAAVKWSAARANQDLGLLKPRPAAAIRREALGTLEPGIGADASVLELRKGSFDYEDADSVHITGGERLFPAGMVIAGSWWEGPGRDPLPLP